MTDQIKLYIDQHLAEFCNSNAFGTVVNVQALKEKLKTHFNLTDEQLIGEAVRYAVSNSYLLE